MKKSIILSAVVAASVVTAVNLGSVSAEDTKKLCRPLLSTSCIVSGDVGSCVDPLVAICDKLGIEIINGINCPVIIISGNCIPEEEISTEVEDSTEDNCPEIEVEKPEVPTAEVVTTQQVIPESPTTETEEENDTEIPNVPETTKVPETTQNPTTKPEIETAPEENTSSVINSYAKQVVEIVNKERAKAGLKALTLDVRIEAAALIRAKETEISFSHTRPNGSSFSTVLRENGISFRGAGENIAWGQRSPEQVMNGWMNSSGHRANILNPNYTKIGVGYYKSQTGRQYWTQLFTY